MKITTLGFAVALAVFTTPASATVLSFGVSGTLGNDGLQVNRAFNGASFSGNVEVDTDMITVTTGNAVNHRITGYDINVLATGGEVFSFLSDGEDGEDESTLSLNPQSSVLTFFIFENINDPLMQGFQRSTLRFDFRAGTPGPTFSIADLLAADPNPGTASNFELGLLQFSTSQGPTSVVSAAALLASAPQPSAVPLPAGGLLLLSGLAGIAGLSRRKSRG